MKKRPMPKGISEEKFKEIQEMIEVQIRDDVKHFSEIWTFLVFGGAAFLPSQESPQEIFC